MKRYRILQVRIEETTNLLIKKQKSNFKNFRTIVTNNLLMRS